MVGGQYQEHGFSNFGIANNTQRIDIKVPSAEDNTNNNVVEDVQDNEESKDD